MADSIKLSADEMQTINDIRQFNANLAMDLGNLELTKIQIKKREELLHEKHDEMKEEEQKFLQSLVDKYGPGAVNLDDGSFIPDPNAKAESSVEPEVETAFDE